jgi:hypothetical protein
MYVHLLTWQVPKWQAVAQTMGCGFGQMQAHMACTDGHTLGCHKPAYCHFERQVCSHAQAKGVQAQEDVGFLRLAASEWPRGHL